MFAVALQLLTAAFARHHVKNHSCYVDPEVIRETLTARQKVPQQVWGLGLEVLSKFLYSRLNFNKLPYTPPPVEPQVPKHRPCFQQAFTLLPVGSRFHQSTREPAKP